MTIDEIREFVRTHEVLTSDSEGIWYVEDNVMKIKKFDETRR